MARNIRAGIIAGQKSTRQKQTEAAKKRDGTYKKPVSVKTGDDGGKPWDGKHAGFASMETFGRAIASNAKGLKEGTAQTYGAILREVERDPEYSQHVDPDKTALKPPTLLYGNIIPENLKRPPQALKSALSAYQENKNAETFAAALEASLDQRYKNAKVLGRQRVRVAGQTDIFGKPAYRYEDKLQPVKQSDHVLLAGVISLPEKLTDKQEEWEKRSLAFLKKEFGNSLKGVILHEDESNPHLHFYVTPDGDNPLSNRVHPGLAAKLKLKQKINQENEDNWNEYQAKLKAWDDKGRIGKQPAKPPTRKALPPENKAAYAAGMREFQNRFYAAVSQPLGMKRKADKGRQREPNRQRYLLQKWTSSLTAGLDDWERRQNAIHLKHNNKIQEKITELTALTTNVPTGKFGSYKSTCSDLEARLNKIGSLARMIKKNNEIHVSKLKKIASKRKALNDQYEKTLKAIENGEPWQNEYSSYKQKIEKQLEKEMQQGQDALGYLYEHFQSPDFNIDEFEEVINAGRKLKQLVRNAKFKDLKKQRRWERVQSYIFSPKPMAPWQNQEMAELIGEEIAEIIMDFMENLKAALTGRKPEKSLEQQTTELEEYTKKLAQEKGIEF